MPSDKLFLGVDGGQSSTVALIGDASGRVLGSGRGGPCNHVTGPERRQKFLNAIGGAVREACSQAGLAPDHREFEAACFGFSGGPADKRPLIEEMFSIAHLNVTTDGWIALAGATAGHPGIIVVAGTGSIAYGRNARGQTMRAGGWGYLFGDEGGGFHIVRQALRAALKLEEGWGPATTLRQRLLEETGAPTANDLMHWLYTPEWPRPRAALLALIVDRAAQDGDAIAREILEGEANELALFVSAIRRAIFAAREPARVCPIGGVWKCEILRTRFAALVKKESGNAFTEPELGPAAGALLEAYRAAGLDAALTALPAHEKP